MNLIRCLVLDVDGVLTDGRLYYGESGDALRAYHVQDGIAIGWFQRLGGVVAILSGKDSPAVAARARDLRIEHVIQGSRDKLADLTALLERLHLRFDQTAMVGDDLPDLAAMRRVGLAIAPANAAPQVMGAARLVTQRRGGRGAVREAIEHILQTSGQWPQVLAWFGGADA